MGSPAMLLLYEIRLLCSADACTVSAPHSAAISESLTIAVRGTKPAAVSQSLTLSVFRTVSHSVHRCYPITILTVDDAIAV